MIIRRRLSDFLSQSLSADKRWPRSGLVSNHSPLSDNLQEVMRKRFSANDYGTTVQSKPDRGQISAVAIVQGLAR